MKITEEIARQLGSLMYLRYGRYAEVEAGGQSYYLDQTETEGHYPNTHYGRITWAGPEGLRIRVLLTGGYVEMAVKDADLEVYLEAADTNIRPRFGLVFYGNDTKEIKDKSLRLIVERALIDLTAEGKRRYDESWAQAKASVAADRAKAKDWDQKI